MGSGYIRGDVILSLEVVVDKPFLKREYQGHLLQIFNNRIFHEDFKISLDSKANRIIGASTANFIINPRPLNVHDKLSSIPLEFFNVFVKEDLVRIGKVGFNIDYVNNEVKLVFDVSQKIILDNLFLEIFCHFITMLLLKLKKDNDRVILHQRMLLPNIQLLRVELIVPKLVSSELNNRIKQTFEMLFLQRDNNKDYTYHVNLGLFKNALENNRILFKAAKDARKMAPPPAFIKTSMSAPPVPYKKRTRMDENGGKTNVMQPVKKMRPG